MSLTCPPNNTLDVLLHARMQTGTTNTWRENNARTHQATNQRRRAVGGGLDKHEHHFITGAGASVGDSNLSSKINKYAHAQNRDSVMRARWWAEAVAIVGENTLRCQKSTSTGLEAWTSPAVIATTSLVWVSSVVLKVVRLMPVNAGNVGVPV